jgi:hypothetical protein
LFVFSGLYLRNFSIDHNDKYDALSLARATFLVFITIGIVEVIEKYRCPKFDCFS